MSYYVPGTEEKDTSKIVRSLMQAHEFTATNTTNIASNTAAITALQANPYKLATFTRVLSVASGNQSVTGVGFMPRLIQFQTGISGGATWYSAGQSDGTTNTCIETALNSGGTLGSFIQPFAGVQRDNAAGTNLQTFVIVTMDADGFTVAWTKTGSPTATATVNAICFR